MTATYWIAWAILTVVNVALFVATTINLRRTLRLLDKWKRSVS